MVEACDTYNGAVPIVRVRADRHPRYNGAIPIVRRRLAAHTMGRFPLYVHVRAKCVMGRFPKSCSGCGASVREARARAPMYVPVMRGVRSLNNITGVRDDDDDDIIDNDDDDDGTFCMSTYFVSDKPLASPSIPTQRQ